MEITFAKENVILAIDVDLISLLRGKENAIVDSYGSYVGTHRYSTRSKRTEMCSREREADIRV
jgi:hypothetical protein